MKIRTYLIITFISFIVGIMVFAYLREWIIIRGPLKIQHSAQAPKNITKKNAKLFFWRNGKWQVENHELLWSDNHAENLYYLINSLLTLLDEENIMHKKVTLQTAMISASGNDAYISFDRNPLPLEEPTLHAWMWVEGLLKTIRENKIPLQSVTFLVHHQSLTDNHLDFSRPWPLQGFLDLP